MALAAHMFFMSSSPNFNFKYNNLDLKSSGREATERQSS